ncbi:MAG: class I SAM-dependent methyltransferase [Ardenticatenaceae bacterium]|nr:class I SAM-dependent methyltransferase [Ardenticatenaceae bacterium]
MMLNAMIRRLFFELRYRLGRAPWDTGISPPELKAVIQGPDARLPGRALDLGCGTGTNSIYMARHGWEATGVDFAGSPIAAARARAREAGVSQRTRFLQGDVTRLGELPLSGPFDLVLDIGCFHGLSPAGRAGYAAGLKNLTQPGAILLLYAFMPRAFLGSTLGLSPDDVRATFEPAFEVVEIAAGADPGGSGSAWYRLRRR